MIHLEVLVDQSTEAFLRSQREFMAWRGVPKLMISDSKKTFKGRLLRKCNAQHGIKWQLNLARAHYCGGMFEHHIRPVKRCLIKSVMKIKLTYEELTTVTSETEGILNNRPLTYACNNE